MEIVVFSTVVAIAINLSPAGAICRLPFDVTKAHANQQIYKEANCKIGLAEWYNYTRYPVTWNCGHLKTDSPTDVKCIYRGKTYKLNERIREEDPTDHYIGCRCDRPFQFSCLYVECDTFFNRPRPPCYLVSEQGRSCPTKRCPKPGEVVHKCERNGQTLLEGQIYLKGDKICTCSKELDGTPESEEKNCKEKTINCDVELLHLDKVAGSRCAPIFLNGIDGCPFEWRCYGETKEEEHVVTVGATTPSEDQIEKCPTLTCQYGPLQVPIGSTLSTRKTDHNVTCTCYVPPMVTCTRTYP